MAGLNVYAGKSDPVVMADDAYPEWIWTLLEPKKKTFTEGEMLSREYMRKLSGEKIKANAMRKKL